MFQVCNIYLETLHFWQLMVQEHFSTPLFFAQRYFNLDAELLPFPSGTGHMVQALKSSQIDVGVGLTEGWVAAMGKKETTGAFKMIGTYVKSPLCWAINVSETGNVKSVDDLVGKVIGISRFGRYDIVYLFKKIVCYILTKFGIIAVPIS